MRFFFSSPLPLVAFYRCKPSKTPIIRRVHIPSFIFLTNPPSGGAVRDGVLWGVPLQGIEPRKGIATLGARGWTASCASSCKGLSPVRGLRPDSQGRCGAGGPPQLQGIEPRKGIATGSRRLEEGLPPLLQGIEPRKGIATPPHRAPLHKT